MQLASNLRRKRPFAPAWRGAYIQYIHPVSSKALEVASREDMPCFVERALGVGLKGPGIPSCRRRTGAHVAEDLKVKSFDYEALLAVLESCPQVLRKQGGFLMGPGNLLRVSWVRYFGRDYCTQALLSKATRPPGNFWDKSPSSCCSTSPGPPRLTVQRFSPAPRVTYATLQDGIEDASEAGTS